MGESQKPVALNLSLERGIFFMRFALYTRKNLCNITYCNCTPMGVQYKQIKFKEVLK